MITNIVIAVLFIIVLLMWGSLGDLSRELKREKQHVYNLQYRVWDELYRLDRMLGDALKLLSDQYIEQKFVGGFRDILNNPENKRKD